MNITPPSRRRIPVYRKIADQLRVEILTHGIPGHCFPSQNELARRFNIAPGTAREAVALLVQEGLLERYQGQGTFVRDNRRRTVVGIVSELDLSHPNVSPFFLHVVQRLRRHFAAAGYTTRVYVGHATPYADCKPNRITSEEFWMDLEAGHLIGVVDVGSPLGLVQAAIGNRPIQVIHSGSLGGHPFVDYLALTSLGVRVVAQRRRQRVACIDLGASDRPSLRLSCFAEEVFRQGLVTHPEWQVAVEYRHSAGDGAKAFERLWESRSEKPDALLVLDDVLYADLAPELIRRRISVPEELMVVSHANLRECRWPLPVPIRLAIDPDELAAAIVHNFIRRQKDPDAPVERLPVPIHVIEPERSRGVESDVTRNLAAAGIEGR